MQFSIEHETVISLESIPLQWISLVDLYNTSLPQFPLKYVHVIHNGERIFGFPFSYDLSRGSKGSVTWKFKFLSNVPLTGSKRECVKAELRHRLGAENPVVRGDIEGCCPENDSKRSLLLEIWDAFVTPMYGGSLPFGRFYDGVYSFARCAAAFIPQSGRKSESQMLYDFIRHYGEKVSIVKPWDFLEFFLLPTYDELLKRDLDNFPTYKILQNSIDKFAARYFTRRFITQRLSLRTVGPRITDLDGHDLLSPNGMRDLTTFLVDKGTFTIEEKREFDFLIDAFNRLATRALGFIGLSCNAKPENDFRTWSGLRFKQFYVRAEKERTVGIYPKIWGMILQQGFGNPEVIPIDVWIESFYRVPLQIDSKERFLESFAGIGKLERMIWVTVQARKTNMYSIFDWLWCLKYGTGKTTKEITGSNTRRLRLANPLSCLHCPLKKSCLAYSEIDDLDIYVAEVEDVPRESKIKPKIRTEFIVLTIKRIPKYVFRRVNSSCELIDGFTGLEIHKKTSFRNEKVIVSEFMRDLARTSVHISKRPST